MTGTVEHEPTSTSDTNFNNTTSINDEESPKRQFRFDVDGRVLAIPLMGVATGFSIGMIRGGRAAGLRFLAENAHNPPKTVRGWYFYNKTKNYRMMWAGLRDGTRGAVNIGTFAVVWVAFESAVSYWSSLARTDAKDAKNDVNSGAIIRVPHSIQDVVQELEKGKEFVAGIGTAAFFSAWNRLGWRMSARTMFLGGVLGGGLSVLREVKGRIGERIIKERREPANSEDKIQRSN